MPSSRAPQQRVVPVPLALIYRELRRQHPRRDDEALLMAAQHSDPWAGEEDWLWEESV